MSYDDEMHEAAVAAAAHEKFLVMREVDHEIGAHERIEAASAGANAPGWDPIEEIRQLDPRDPAFDQKLTAISERANDPWNIGL